MAISQGYGMKKMKRKGAKQTQEQQPNNSPSKTLDVADLDEKIADNNDCALVKLIRDRYRMLVDNSVNTLLFIIVKCDKGGELSGHIDLNQRFQEDPNFQKYLKGTQPILPQQGDLTFLNWKKGRPVLSHSDNWEIVTKADTAMLRNKHSTTLVTLDMAQHRQGTSLDSSQESNATKSKGKSKKETREKKSSTEWTELSTTDQNLSGFRILFWDVFLK